MHNRGHAEADGRFFEVSRTHIKEGKLFRLAVVHQIEHVHLTRPGGGGTFDKPPWKIIELGNRFFFDSNNLSGETKSPAKIDNTTKIGTTIIIVI